MRHLKMFGLAALAAASMAFAVAGTATATNLDDATGTLETFSALTAESEGTTELHPPIGSIRCEESHAGGLTGTVGTPNATVSMQALSWSKCNATVSVLEKGILTIASSGSNNGSVRGYGQEVTVMYLGFHCIFKTELTSLGTLTGSATTGGNATLDISAKIPRTGGSSGAFCGSTAQWTGSYKVTSPSTLNVTP